MPTAIHRLRFERSPRKGRDTGDITNKMALAFSVGGALKDPYDPAIGETAPYETIEIGKPIIVRYKSFFFKASAHTGDLNRVMVSTMLKQDTSKTPGAEAVNYFNTASALGGSDLRIDAFGGEDYGHELIYYSHSYVGEAIRMTTKVMELDSLSSEAVKGLSNIASAAGALPLFSSFAPTLASAAAGVSIFQRILNWLNTDDPIFSGASMDLHFNVPNAQRLQSGRYVMVAGMTDDKLLDGQYALHTTKNTLLRGGQPVTDRSYFVFQVNRESHPDYKSFDHFKGAAEMLAKTNRPGSLVDLSNTIVKVMADANDIETVRKIRELSGERDDPKVKKEIEAWRKRLSGEMSSTLKDYLDQLLA